jgi:glycosyltransferase involved in cell wall biosynthesis
VGDEDFAVAIAAVTENAERRAAMRMAARDYALTASWDSVFEGVYAVYKGMLSGGGKEDQQPGGMSRA